MSQSTELFSFSLSLGLRAHQQAQRFYQHHTDHKAQQVYLNTLSVIAVQDYLSMLGYTTDWNNSFSSQPVQQTLMNCSDIWLPGYGRIECLHSFEDEDRINVSAEVWADRIGFLWVQLSRSLREARLLGFVSQITQGQVAIADLRPLEELNEWLRSHQTQNIAQTLLSNWFSQVHDTWNDLTLTLDEFLAPAQLATEFRHSMTIEENLSPEVCRSKQIHLEGHPLEIIIGLQSISGQETEVWVLTRSRPPSEALPLALRMRLLDSADVEVMTAQSNGTEAIQFRFSASSNEIFKLQLTLNQSAWLEIFSL